MDFGVRSHRCFRTDRRRLRQTGSEAFGPLGLTTLAVYLAFFRSHGAGVRRYAVGLKISPPWPFTESQRSHCDRLCDPQQRRYAAGEYEDSRQQNGRFPGGLSFSLPLGATINMDGTAIYQGVCAIFVGFAIGTPLTFSQQLTIIATSVLASIGTAGVPGAGAIMLMLVLESVGLKVESGTPVAMAYAMIFGIDALLDMGRTACNVTGDLAVTCIVAKTENQMDISCWQSDDKPVGQLAESTTD